MAVQGYHEVARAGHFWPTQQGYGGGSIDQWAPTVAHSSQLWALFDQMERARSATRIWWHLCMHPGTTLALAQSVLDVLRQHVGSNVPVYASAMATYANATECKIADPSGSASILQQLLAAGSVRQGPLLQPLSTANTTDGCHPLPSIWKVDGRSLKVFFR